MDATAPSMDSMIKSSGLLMKARAIRVCPFHAQAHICRSFGSGSHYAEHKRSTILVIRRTAVQAAAHACTCKQ